MAVEKLAKEMNDRFRKWNELLFILLLPLIMSIFVGCADVDEEDGQYPVFFQDGSLNFVEDPTFANCIQSTINDEEIDNPSGVVSLHCPWVPTIILEVEEVVNPSGLVSSVYPAIQEIGSYTSDSRIDSIGGIEGFIYLTDFGMSSHDFSTIDWSPLLNSDNLTRLAFYRMSNVNLSSISFSSISKLSQLSFFLCEISDLDGLSNSINLRELDLSSNQILDTNLEPLSNLLNLEKLSITGIGFFGIDSSTIDVAPLSGLTKLTELEIGSSSNTLLNIDDLQSLINITTLDLNNSIITCAELTQLEAVLGAEKISGTGYCS
ncbi:MAG: leucine-rich repeat domain-containing protein [Proteobacteria bacterium]|nr:leucine-rich repeat domain-containing protein [Pseudomonadota bacterium]